MPKQITNPDYYLTNNSKIASAGTGYAVNDILTLSGGTFTIASSIRVTAINAGGIITAFTVQALGDYSVLPANPINLTGGLGTGATLAGLFVARNAGYTPITHYRSNTAGVLPPVGTLYPGELFINTADASIYVGDASGNPEVIGGAGIAADIAIVFAVALG